ncbi:hypothetical protein KI387_043704 [Taxus chinensis]|uniref:Uncharacterized protein n=1 Tax=Taxus chinensis TaxID=29808 RepID=A0AA38GZB7_TAXCH|nr:hypothetical protein KI387_043704 [Taxus chinensis]
MTTINKEPKDKGWVHEPREEGEIMKHKLEGINPLIFHDDSMISNEGMLQEEREEKSDLQDGEERLKGEAQIVKGRMKNHMSCFGDDGIWHLHISLQGYVVPVDPLNCKEEEALDIVTP